MRGSATATALPPLQSTGAAILDTAAGP